MKKFFLIFGILFLISLTFVSAQPPFEQTTSSNGYQIIVPQLGILKQNQDFNFNFHLKNFSNGYPIDNTTTDCFIDIQNSSGNQILSLQVPHIDSNVINEWEINVLGGNFSITGDYAYTIQCSDSTTHLGNTESLGIEVTPTGSPQENIQLYARIFLILLFISLIFIIQWNQKRIDYEKWYKNIAQKYQTKNTFKWILSALGFNMFKNSYVFSYLVGLLGLLVLTELTLFFNITSVLSIMKIVLGIYTWGALVVIILFFSQIQEWLVGWKEDIEKINWGNFGNGKQ